MRIAPIQVEDKQRGREVCSSSIRRACAVHALALLYSYGVTVLPARTAVEGPGHSLLTGAS